MRQATLSIVLFLALFIGELIAEEIRFARYPHVSHDGRVTFSYHGDIWIAEADGSHPRRLTAHIARDTFPRFSPDGKWIAFNSDRWGNGDVWIIPVAGGKPTQSTFHSTNDSVLYWTPDGKGVLISSSRGSHPWGSPLFVVPRDGGMPKPLPMDRGSSGMIRQDGKMVAFNRMGFRYWRKHYRGNNNTDIWVHDLESGALKQLTDLDGKEYRSHTQDAHPMWGHDGMIYFMSERDGLFNIWRISPEGGAPEQVTRHDKDGIQYPSISPDGRIIVYESDFLIWKLDVPDGRPKPVKVELAFDPKENRLEPASCESKADGFSPSPDGTEVAIDFHGEVFLVPSDPEIGEKTQVTSSCWRDRYQTWSPDGRWLAFISDRSLEEEVWVYNIAEKTHKQLTKHESTKGNLLWSPDSKRLLFQADKRLFIANIESGESEEIAFNDEGGFSVRSFSSDGKWLCYSRRDASLNSDVYLFNIDQRQENNITQHLARDSSGLLTPDGKKMIFASDRDDGTNHLWTVSLMPLTEDPDDPLVKKKTRGKSKVGKSKKEETNEDSGIAEEDTEDDSEQEDEDKDLVEVVEALNVEMNLENIDRRARKLTTGDAIGSFFLSKDGKTVTFVQAGALHSISVDGGETKKIADGSFRGLAPTQDLKSVFYTEDGGVWKLSLSDKKKTQIKYDLKVWVNHEQEWEQIFEECWRVMKYRFYDENMHGIDWEATKAIYKPRLKQVGENQDLYDLCNEMIGELNASHTGVSGPPTRTMEKVVSTPSLGFEVQPGKTHYQISHIYRDGPADKEWLDLKVGDALVAIEGHDIQSGDNFYWILNQLLNDYIAVTIASVNEDGALDAPRTLRLKPVDSLRNIKYEEWVHQNRKRVDSLSGGKIGYVHIRSMSRGPLRRFENEIDQYWDKNGMIIDIRFNGGGNIDQELIDILERRPYEYWNSRRGGRSWGRRPRQCIAGPKVMLINWRSASDSEVTPQAFRDLELGRIVGNPTYGAVIATGGYGLINGGRIRTPGALVTTYDPTQPNNYGINLENFGVAPDVWIENSPDDELAGRDAELEAAVAEALRMLSEGTWQYGEDD